MTIERDPDTDGYRAFIPGIGWVVGDTIDQVTSEIDRLVTRYGIDKKG